MPKKKVDVNVPNPNAGPPVVVAVMDADSQVHEIWEDKVTGKYQAYSEAGELMGWLGYTREKNVVTIYTTRTEPDYRGQGVASTLTRKVLDDCREAGVEVDAACWYAAEFVQRHPMYARMMVNLGF
ncbi:MAG: N-acetyltransferase [Cellulomonadaceae bacterium]|nr:N-acetyltransferase [Cellulomonadaceae bacterium]